MTISIYSPEVRALSQAYGIPELQAYRRLKAEQKLRRQDKALRFGIIRRLFERKIDNFAKTHPDWNRYT